MSSMYEVICLFGGFGGKELCESLEEMEFVGNMGSTKHNRTVQLFLGWSGGFEGY